MWTFVWTCKVSPLAKPGIGPLQCPAVAIAAPLSPCERRAEAQIGFTCPATGKTAAACLVVLDDNKRLCFKQFRGKRLSPTRAHARRGEPSCRQTNSALTYGGLGL